MATLLLAPLDGIRVATVGRGSRLLTLPRRQPRGAVEPGAVEVHVRDPTGVADVLERVCIEDDEGGTLAGGERPKIGKAEQLRRSRGSRDDGVGWRQTELDPPPDFVMVRGAERVARRDARVGAEHQLRAGSDHLL